LSKTALELIDELISGWNQWEANEVYYLTELVPAIVGGDNSIRLMSNEREIVAELRELLTSDEWEQLPDLIKAQHEHRVIEIESDRKRQLADHAQRMQKEVERRKRLEADRERLHREQQERSRQEEAERERLQQEAIERDRRQAELEGRQSALRKRALSLFYASFLSADSLILQDQDYNLLDIDQYEQWKVRFVQKWAETKGTHLDIQQAKAVSTVGRDVQVIARAGAGKTRTLITRALFLQVHCNVSPDELLLLAFNKSAALEMQDRLDRSLAENCPHVMTFHALAHALVHPEEELIYDDPRARNLGLSREIQKVIDQHLQSEQYRPLIRDLMLSHFREDWERIVDGGFHLSISDLIKHRTALPRETLSGKYVKSFGEKLISNILFQHNIDYEYEGRFRWSGVIYKPDFTILLEERRGVIIEYFGLKGEPEYDQDAQQKRKFWEGHEGWTLLEFSPQDIKTLGVDGFTSLLLRRLEAVGVKGCLLSDEEIWERIRDRAIDSFTGAVKSFVSRCRKRDLSIEGLRRLINEHEALNNAERLFLTVCSSVYSAYTQRIKDNGLDDFDGLLWNAVKLLEAGISRFTRRKGREHGNLSRIRYVLIDEFQDYSEMFFRLSSGIRAVSPQVEFFCVGDDWQAINGFAGSDLQYFNNFKALFNAPKTLNVSTNYRSPALVVQVGNALMSGRGTPAIVHQSESGWVRRFNLTDFIPTVSELARHNREESTPALLRMVKLVLDSGQDVVLLSRRNGVPWYVNYPREFSGQLDGLERFAEHIRSFFPKEDRKRVTASTVHKYKGREEGAVIVLDANAGCYPLIHPNWVFLRIFGDSLDRIVDEERRLFYVALTRAKHSLIILSESTTRASPYMDDIHEKMHLAWLSGAELPLVQPPDGARLEVRVFRAYKVRDQLKETYHWNEPLKYWYRSVMAEGFNFHTLCGQSWAKDSSVRIEVYSETGDLIASRP